MEKNIIESTSNSSQGSRSSQASQQGAPNPYERDFNSYTRPVGHERNTRAPKVPVKKDSRGSDATYQKALEAMSAQESSSDDLKRSPAPAAGSSEVNQQVTKEGTSSERATEMDLTSQKDVTAQDKKENLDKTDLNEQLKITSDDLNELNLDDLTLGDETTTEDIFESPMASDEMMSNRGNEESYFTEDEITLNMSFKTAMKEADRAQGITSFEDIPESLIESNQTGKIVNSRIYDLEQQQSALESSAEEWKVQYERQVQIAEESVKIADDREMEGYIAVNELNESMSEETAKRSRHMAKLKDQCDELPVNKDMFKLKDDLKLRDENIETLQKESADHQKRADDALKVAQDLRELLATEGELLKEDINKVTEENEQLKEAGQRAAECGQRWEDEARRLDTKVTKVELESKEHQKKIRELTDENIKLNTELVDMTQTAMTHQYEITQSRKQLKVAADAYAQLEQQMNQLIEQIRQRETDEKELNEETIQRQNFAHMLKQERDQLRTENEQLTFRIKRLEDENRGLQVTNKHREELLLQRGSAKRDTADTPPPSHSKAQEAGGSFHFEMPLRTGGGTGGLKTEGDGETTDNKKPSSSHQPHMNFGDPSQFQQPIETAVKDGANQDARSPRHEHDGRYFREYQNERNQRDDRNENRGQREFNRSIRNMGRKTVLATFDGNRAAVS
ncbi:uncharacterized protein LOC129581549 [Paramacrobiotus metropolitanus]|uniref:uncharacterized protein LOC129581549 n=1 Tax=Paramacrobiotus metropolitanus TaxID=2943436 RepID=UPI0024458B5B|nr:uncharacterized protein LOC129581549 [Paramacrobiotus metropolitanus]